MPIIGVPLKPGNAGANVHELHEQLSGLGAVIASGEQTATMYGDSTVAAVRAFRQQYGLPAGDNLDLSTGRLMHAASVFAGPGGREDLATAVRTATAAADTNQPQELYWLARYATIAGDYQTAHSIARRIPDHDGIKAVVDPILALPDQPSSAAALADASNLRWGRASAQACSGPTRGHSGRTPQTLGLGCWSGRCARSMSNWNGLGDNAASPRRAYSTCQPA